MRLKKILVPLLLVAACGACKKTQTTLTKTEEKPLVCGPSWTPNTLNTVTLTVDGVQRTMGVHTCSTYQPCATQNVATFFHGWGGTISSVDSKHLEYFLALYGGTSCLVLIPQGLVQSPWNVTGWDQLANSQDWHLQLAIESWLQQFQVTSRGCVGFSNGSIWCLSMQSFHPGHFNKLAYVAGEMWPGPMPPAVSTPTVGVPLFMSGGVRDSTVLISNQRALRSQFRSLDGCATGTVAWHGQTHDPLCYHASGCSMAWCEWQDDGDSDETHWYAAPQDSDDISYFLING